MLVSDPFASRSAPLSRGGTAEYIGCLRHFLTLHKVHKTLFDTGFKMVQPEVRDLRTCANWIATVSAGALRDLENRLQIRRAHRRRALWPPSLARPEAQAPLESSLARLLKPLKKEVP